MGTLLSRVDLAGLAIPPPDYTLCLLGRVTSVSWSVNAPPDHLLEPHPARPAPGQDDGQDPDTMGTCAVCGGPRPIRHTGRCGYACSSTCRWRALRARRRAGRAGYPA
jgi:hypothetical protein